MVWMHLCVSTVVDGMDAFVHWCGSGRWGHICVLAWGQMVGRRVLVVAHRVRA